MERTERRKKNWGELAIGGVCVLLGILLSVQLRSVKMNSAADATSAGRLETLQQLYNETVDSLETTMNLLSRVKLILFAESLGGVESLVTYPMTQTHESVPEETREALGINERFIRISIGIENVNDIIADLEQALA